MPWYYLKRPLEDSIDILLRRTKALVDAQRLQGDEIMGLREDLDAAVAGIENDLANIDGTQASVVALLEKLNAERADAIKTGDIERIKALDAAIEARTAALADAVARYTPPTPSGA